MPVEVILPKVDMDMATGKISKWHVRDGETVKKGQPLFEIETDKSAMEIEAPADGTAHDLAPTATDIAVGTAVAFILAPGEKSEAIRPAGSAAPSAGPRMAQAAAIAAGAIPAAPTANNRSAGGKFRATPLARRLARQKNISLAAVAGSGPRGRIVAKDVELVGAAPIAAGTATDNSALPAIVSHYAPGSYNVKPLDGMRRTIAQRLVHSKQTVPHFYLKTSCVLDAMLETRSRLNGYAPRDAAGTPAWKLSVNDFVIKALAMALQRVPDANVTWSDDGILQHRSSDIGVAVSVEGGLYTPVVREADSKSLAQISIEMKDLAARAKARKLQPTDYQGGTSAISNLGMFGIEEFQAIINPPHATILAVGAGIEQFVPVAGKPELKTIMKATLSCDHRAVDGALGAELLAAFRRYLEDPALMLV